MKNLRHRDPLVACIKEAINQREVYVLCLEHQAVLHRLHMDMAECPLAWRDGPQKIDRGPDNFDKASAIAR